MHLPTLIPTYIHNLPTYAYCSMLLFVSLLSLLYKAQNSSTFEYQFYLRSRLSTEANTSFSDVESNVNETCLMKSFTTVDYYVLNNNYQQGILIISNTDTYNIN